MVKVKADLYENDFWLFSFYVERLTSRFEPTETEFTSQLCKDLHSEVIEANCLCKYILLPYLHDHNLQCAVLILSGCAAEALEYSSIFKLNLWCQKANDFFFVCVVCKTTTGIIILDAPSRHLSYWHVCHFCLTRISIPANLRHVILPQPLAASS